ncbi:MAG: hypothetical protein HYV95_17385 [Opitutae bacterium]|nr:hypothetical protein [Opitutae bacterium]
MKTTDARATPLLEQLRTLQCELVDLAFLLNQRGRVDAADTALDISMRLKEILESQPTPRG